MASATAMETYLKTLWRYGIWTSRQSTELHPTDWIARQELADTNLRALHHTKWLKPGWDLSGGVMI